MKLLQIFALLSLSYIVQSNNYFPGTIRFLTDVETGKIQDRFNPHDGWHPQHVAATHSVNIVTEGELQSPKPRSGTYSARLEVRPGENPLNGNYQPRVQLRQHANPLKAAKGYYIGFSVFIPKSWNPGAFIHVTQIFSESKGDSGSTLGPLHTLVIDESGAWSVRGAYSSAPNNSPTTPVGNIGGLGKSSTHPVKKGRWTDFTYYVNFSLTTTMILDY